MVWACLKLEGDLELLILLPSLPCNGGWVYTTSPDFRPCFTFLLLFIPISLVSTCHVGVGDGGGGKREWDSAGQVELEGLS